MPGSRFYTRRGDAGYTATLGAGSVSKDDPRPEAWGTVDEAQAVLGWVRTLGCAAETGEIVLAVQQDLRMVMAELAAAGSVESPFAGSVTAADVARLEGWLGRLEAQVDMPREFVVPGESQPGAGLHLARTIVRRAERRVVRLLHEGLLTNGWVVAYLNRLSSLLFALALREDQLGEGLRMATSDEAET